MTVSAWLSAAAKNSKSDDPNGHRFCDKKSVTQKMSKPMYSTASFLFSVRFVSDAALLRSLLCLVCRSSDSSIQAARLIAACDLAPYCQRIASAFSPGHDSPSNDRFSPHAGTSALTVAVPLGSCTRFPILFQGPTGPEALKPLFTFRFILPQPIGNVNKQPSRKTGLLRENAVFILSAPPNASEEAGTGPDPPRRGRPCCPYPPLAG